MPHLSASSALSSSRPGQLGSAGSPCRAGGSSGEIRHRHHWLAAQSPRNMAAQPSRRKRMHLLLVQPLIGDNAIDICKEKTHFRELI